MQNAKIKKEQRHRGTKAQSKNIIQNAKITKFIQNSEFKIKNSKTTRPTKVGAPNSKVKSPQSTDHRL
jgi:hypothetical protein